jgi:hypothetical protein
MEVDSPIRAPVEIRESAGGSSSSKGGAGVIVNDLQVFIFTAFWLYNHRDLLDSVLVLTMAS